MADETKKIRRVQSQIDQAEGKITQLVQETETNTKDINNNYNEIIQKLDGLATEDDLVAISNKVETIQTSADYAINIVEDIQVNGVSKVTTETGYKFDADGLEISKTGAETKSVLNEKGLDIRDSTGSSSQSLLFAGYDTSTGETIVKSKNMTVEKYLVIGKYSRIEDYEPSGTKATGIFWIGG